MRKERDLKREKREVKNRWEKIHRENKKLGEKSKESENIREKLGENRDSERGTEMRRAQIEERFRENWEQSISTKISQKFLTIKKSQSNKTKWTNQNDEKAR